MSSSNKHENKNAVGAKAAMAIQNKVDGRPSAACASYTSHHAVNTFWQLSCGATSQEARVRYSKSVPQ
jgi:hypothetical protein